MDKEIKWTKYLSRRRLSLFKLDMLIRGLLSALKRNRLDFKLNNLLVHARDLETDWYIEEKEFKEGFGKVVLDHFLRCVSRKEDPFMILERYSDDLVSTVTAISKRNISSREDVLSAYETFLERLSDFQLTVWFPVICEGRLFPYAKEILRNYTKDENAWDVITCPFRPSLLQQEQLDLLRLACEFSHDKLRRHHEKYCWMNVSFVEDYPYDLAYYENRLKDLADPEKEIEKIKRELDKKKSEFFNLLDSLRLSYQDRELFIFVNRLNHLRQTRDYGRRTAYCYIRPLFDKIRSFLSADLKTFLSSTPGEVVEALKQGISLKAPKWKSSYIYLLKNRKFELVTENIEDKLHEEGIVLLNTKDVKEIKGITANKGKVRGEAKLIIPNNRSSDLNNFKKGNILITSSTKAEYIVAMEKASAFVTDEGGITCHAAIISREMNKPCIVGTKIATHAIKDGDMVEVDADNGIVRKL